MSKLSLSVQKAAPVPVVPILPGATATGLSLPPGLSYEAWDGIGRTLGQIASAHQWWVGDWWNYGERQYGEMASQASDIGIAPDTLSNWAAVAERVGLPLRNGNLSWSHHLAVAYLPPAEQKDWLDLAERERLDVRELRRRISAPLLEPVALPEGKYRCIVIDPPWPMERIVREIQPDQGPELDYPTMSLADIEALPIADLSAAPGTHIYLWTTHRFLPDALRIFEAWGASYECLMTWVKNLGMTPYSWMYDTEHVVFGRIGQLPLEQLGLRLSFNEAKGRHSAKPEIFYERVIAASPGPRLEMFARREREGFVVWGNEVSAA